MTTTFESPSPADRKRRWPQFTIRGLLVLTAAISLAFGWLVLAVKQRRFQAERQPYEEFVVVAERAQYDGAAQALIRQYAVTIPRDRYVLVRTPDGVGAFMLTEEVNTGDGGVKYRWFWRKGANGSLADSTAIKGESVVYEQYNRLPTGEPGKYEVIDAGGRTVIQCGPVALEWSLGNHIYLPLEEPIEMAYTAVADIQRVDPADPGLLWIRRGLETENIRRPQGLPAADDLR